MQLLRHSAANNILPNVRVGSVESQVAWPNGKASDYESEDYGFESHRDHNDRMFFLSTRYLRPHGKNDRATRLPFPARRPRHRVSNLPMRPGRPNVRCVTSDKGPSTT